MKILMVNKFLYPNGGSETYVFKLGECLVSRGHEVQYFGMEHEGRIVGNHAECYTADMDFHGGGLKKLLYPFKIIYSGEAKKKMYRVLEDFDPDIVHLNNFNFQLTPSVIYAVKKYERKTGRKLRLLYTAHDYQLVCPNHMLLVPNTGELCARCTDGAFRHCTKGRCIHGSRVKSLLGSLEGYLYRFLKTYRSLDTVICPSHFMEEKLSRNPYLSGKTVVLHNFIEKKEKDRKLSDKNKDSSQRYVLYFGRYAAEKGIKTLLETCRRLPEIPFVFAGNGPLESEVGGIPNIKNVGFKSGRELEELVRGAAFTVLPAEWYENCPFSVMETQMYGTPVIGAAIGGIPELIRDGETGLLFESGNLEQLCEKIDNLWNDRKLCEKLTNNCNFINFDTVETYCDRMMSLYKGSDA